MRRTVFAAALMCISWAVAPSAHAEDLDLAPSKDIEQNERVVIQNRKFKLGAEITLGVGALPLDPFAKGIAGTARFTYHFNEFHAWEVGGGTYAFNIDSSLTEQLLKNFGIQRQQLPAMQLLIESDYVLKPFYGKFALANRTLLYQEVFLAVGATVTSWSDGSFRGGPNLGGGLRFFVNEWLSVRFDIRHALVAGKIPFIDPTATVDGVLYLGTGVSFNIGG